MYEPWYDETRPMPRTPCCDAPPMLLDSTTRDPGGSRWECGECHRVYCWSTLMEHARQKVKT